MRSTIVRPWSGHLCWQALRPHPLFLFRRVADRGQAYLGVGSRAAHRVTEAVPGSDQGYRAFLNEAKDWTFGHFGYDVKNALEPLTTRQPRMSGFPDAHWFVPRFVFTFSGGLAHLHAYEEDLPEGAHLLDALLDPRKAPFQPLTDWWISTTREGYIGTVRDLLEHIQRGDVYELNYCTERRTTLAGWDPCAGFERLLERLDPPHAAFYRMDEHYALCASPERFLRFEGREVTAEPMKGTRPRANDPVEDRALAEQLRVDVKERSENIMAVDVMRNDLSRVAARSSVRVEELCTVKTYPRVHQMVSSVRARLRNGKAPVDAVLASFPMASMTGAPKISAMRSIDEKEAMRRGLFSGTLGYFDPLGNGDLNVVIRTVQYDARTGEASLITGSALTALCDPEQEWSECELKANSVMEALAPC